MHLARAVAHTTSNDVHDRMLEDPTYRHIVRWSDSGDSFIVLDVNSPRTVTKRDLK